MGGVNITSLSLSAANWQGYRSDSRSIITCHFGCKLLLRVKQTFRLCIEAPFRWYRLSHRNIPCQNWCIYYKWMMRWFRVIYDSCASKPGSSGQLKALQFNVTAIKVFAIVSTCQTGNVCNYATSSDTTKLFKLSLSSQARDR